MLICRKKTQLLVVGFSFYYVQGQVKSNGLERGFKKRNPALKSIGSKHTAQNKLTPVEKSVFIFVEFEQESDDTLLC